MGAYNKTNSRTSHISTVLQPIAYLVRSLPFYPAKLQAHFSSWFLHLFFTFLLYFDFCFYSSVFLNFLNFFSKSLVKLFLLWYSILALRLFRGVAQLVARVVWDHEVAGSIPVTSTIKSRFYRKL